MANGGFLVKFEFGKKKAKLQRCYAVAFHYDEWAYAINNEAMKNLPKGIEKIVLEIEL